ncbi:MAG: rhomboid family intramembrane serine protease [Planctomycetota bacterium]
MQTDSPVVRIWAALMRTPICTSLLAAGIAGFAACEARKNVDHLLLLPGRELFEPWRYFTTLMPHFTPVQFGLFVLLIAAFGRRVELSLDFWRTLNLVFWAAVIGGGLEAAVFHGPIGLEGVSFAFVAYAYTRARTEPDFEGIATRPNAQLLVAYCAFSVLVGLTGMLPVSHGAQIGGAAVGAAFGFRRDWVPAYLLVLNMGLIAFLQPMLATAQSDTWVLTQLAHQSHRLGQHERAVARYERAVDAGDDSLLTLYRMSGSLERLGRLEEAEALRSEIQDRDEQFLNRMAERE